MTAPLPPIKPGSTLPLAPLAAAGSSGNGKITLTIIHPSENERKPIVFYDNISKETYQPYFSLRICNIDPENKKITLDCETYEDLYCYHTDEYLLEQMEAGRAEKIALSYNDRLDIKWNSKCPNEEQGIFLPIRLKLNELDEISPNKRIHVYIERISGNSSSQTLKLTIEGPFKQERSDKREFKIVQT